jgi:hypothetical protein
MKRAGWYLKQPMLPPLENGGVSAKPYHIHKRIDNEDI